MTDTTDPIDPPPALVMHFNLEANPDDIDAVRRVAAATRNVGARQVALGTEWLAVADAYDELADQIAQLSISKADCPTDDPVPEGFSTEPVDVQSDAEAHLAGRYGNQPQPGEDLGAPEPQEVSAFGDDDDGPPEVVSRSIPEDSPIGDEYTAEMIQQGRARQFRAHEIPGTEGLPGDRTFQFPNRLVLADAVGLPAADLDNTTALAAKVTALLQPATPITVLMATVPPAGAVQLTARSWTALSEYEVESPVEHNRVFLVPFENLPAAIEWSGGTCPSSADAPFTASDARTVAALVPAVLGYNPETVDVRVRVALPEHDIPRRVMIDVVPWPGD